MGDLRSVPISLVSVKGGEGHCPWQRLQLQRGWGLLEQTLDSGQQQECSEARADPTVLSQTGRTGTQASGTSTRAGRRPAGEHAENPL